MPIVRYWPARRDQSSECKDVQYMMQNYLSGLPTLCAYHRKLMTAKALSFIYFYVSVAIS